MVAQPPHDHPKREGGSENDVSLGQNTSIDEHPQTGDGQFSGSEDSSDSDDESTMEGREPNQLGIVSSRSFHGGLVESTTGGSFDTAPESSELVNEEWEEQGKDDSEEQEEIHLGVGPTGAESSSSPAEAEARISESPSSSWGSVVPRPPQPPPPSSLRRAKSDPSVRPSSSSRGSELSCHLDDYDGKNSGGKTSKSSKHISTPIAGFSPTFKDYNDGWGSSNTNRSNHGSKHNHRGSENSSTAFESERLGYLADLLMASAPRLQHLASANNNSSSSSRPGSNLDERLTGGSSSSHNKRKRRAMRVTPTTEQRHPGKPGARLSNYSRPFEPDIAEVVGDGDEDDDDNDNDSSGDKEKNIHYHRAVAAVYLTGEEEETMTNPNSSSSNGDETRRKSYVGRHEAAAAAGSIGFVSASSSTSSSTTQSTAVTSTTAVSDGSLLKQKGGSDDGEMETGASSGRKKKKKGRRSRAKGQQQQQEGEHLNGYPLLFLVIGLCMVVFLMSIDRTIITTAIPYITAEFHSTKDIGWYGSSYLLTACAFQPVFGRVYMLFDVKWSYLLSMFTFELGSLICALSPSSKALIVGRAIAGFGSAGILTGTFVIVATAVPLRMRPLYTAIVGLMFGVGATVGPLIGGLFTDLVSWRWCFWINLPVGAATMLVMILVYRPIPHGHLKRGVVDRLIDLDLIGNFLLMSTSVMLFLALEFTTQGDSWDSVRVVSLLVAFGIGTIIFIAWQWWKQDGALIPPAIATQRTVAASCLAAFCIYGALLIHSYFIPIWFQAILGYSAILSGVAMIPYCVANALFSLFSGIFVSVVGYYVPPAIVGSVIGTVGCGVITLFYPGMRTALWIGFEILASAGFGMMIQQGFTAVQTVVPPDEIAIATAAVVASQSLGGAMFISVGNNVFQNRLRELVGDADIPGFDAKAIVDAGATAFRDMFPPEQLEILIPAYNDALTTVFQVAIPLAGLAFVSCCFMEWKSVKKSPPTAGPDNEQGGAPEQKAQ